MYLDIERIHCILIEVDFNDVLKIVGINNKDSKLVIKDIEENKVDIKIGIYWVVIKVEDIIEDKNYRAIFHNVDEVGDDKKILPNNKEKHIQITLYLNVFRDVDVDLGMYKINLHNGKVNLNLDVDVNEHKMVNEVDFDKNIDFI